MFRGGCGPITSVRQIGAQQPSAYVEWPKIKYTIAHNPLSILDILKMLSNPPAPWRVDPRYHSGLANSISSPDLSRAFGYPSADSVQLQLNISMLNWLSNTDKGARVQYVLFY